MDIYYRVIFLMLVFSAPLMSGEEIIIIEVPEPKYLVPETLLQFPVNRCDKIPEDVVSEKLLQFGAQSLYHRSIPIEFVSFGEFEIKGRKYLLYRCDIWPSNYYYLADITEKCGYPPTLEILQDLGGVIERWFEYDGRNILTIYHLVYPEPGWTTLKTFRYEFTESGLKLMEKTEERPSISPEEHQLRVNEWEMITLDNDFFKK